MASDANGWHTVTMRVPFVSAEHASIAKQVIEVDPELQPKAVRRTVETEAEVLVVTYACSTVRLIRIVSNAFCENVDLIIRTIGEFGPKADF